MKKRITLLYGLLFCLVSLTAQDPVVKTNRGLVSGYKSGEISIFKGIPFAEAPVGSLRWKAPQPKQNWEGTLDCRSFSATPMQNKPVPFMMWTEEFIAPPDNLSEDCLYLNVWTPAVSKREKLPVFVWIYGGGFSSGSAACDIYDGEEMAKKGIVFVSLNYRVGVFGFLAHPELSSESVSGTSGNYGLLDQIAALKWVKDNIQAFGGDPEKVCIAGQSAGSMSVWSLIMSPLARGLFKAAIPQSGGITTNLLNRDYINSERNGTEFMKKAKAADIGELRKLSAGALQAAGSGGAGGLGFAPVFDGYVLPKDINKALEEGNFNKVAVLAGWVTGDANMGFGQTVDKEKYRLDAEKRYGDLSGEYLKLFPGSTPEEASSSTRKMTLLNFAAMPVFTWSKYTPNQLYVYEFDHVPAEKPGFPNYGAFHTSEVPFALHNLIKWKRPWRETDYKVEEIMNKYWVNFIKTGSPNGEGLVRWTEYKASKGDILGISGKINIIPGLYRQEFEFLSKAQQAGK